MLLDLLRVLCWSRLSGHLWRASLVNFGCAWNPPKTAKGIVSSSISGTFKGKLRGWAMWMGNPLRGDRWMKHPKTWCRMNKWSKQTTDYFSNAFIWSESISIYFSCSIHVCSRFETVEKSGLYITAVCILTRLGGKKSWNGQRLIGRRAKFISNLTFVFDNGPCVPKNWSISAFFVFVTRRYTYSKQAHHPKHF